MPHAKPRRGFTLLELLIVITIISILASLIVPNLTQGRQSAKEQAFAANLRDLSQMMTVYYQEFGALPPMGGGDPIPQVVFEATGRTDFPTTTPLGGYWHVGQLETDQWGVGVWWDTDPGDQIFDTCSAIDAQLDDGTPTGGQFVCDLATNRYYWMLK